MILKAEFHYPFFGRICLKCVYTMGDVSTPVNIIYLSCGIINILSKINFIILVVHFMLLKRASVGSLVSKNTSKGFANEQYKVEIMENIFEKKKFI